MKTRKFSTK